jgi:hypothetical protein
MDEKRKDIDQFLMTDWVPQFAKETFADSAIRVEWLRAVEGNESDRLEFLVHMGPMLQSAINEKRQELIAPLDRAELALSRRLDDNYNEMLAMNTTLTGLLAAAADNTATQQQILRQLDPEQKLPQYLAKTDEIARLLVDRVHDYATNKPKVDSLLALLTASPQ